VRANAYSRLRRGARETRAPSLDISSNGMLVYNTALLYENLKNVPGRAGLKTADVIP
jgi:hypothetical protein